MHILICVNILTIIVLLLLLFQLFSNNTIFKKNSLFFLVKRVCFDYTCARCIHKTTELEARFAVNGLFFGYFTTKSGLFVCYATAVNGLLFGYAKLPLYVGSSERGMSRTPNYIAFRINGFTSALTTWSVAAEI